MTSAYLRLKKAIAYLKANESMLQQDIATRMGMTKVSFSRGLSRCKERKDENFIIQFHEATNEMFSLDWLLNGDGDKFADKNGKDSHSQSETVIDSSSAFNAAIAAHVRIIDTLEQQLRDKATEMDARLSDKDKIIAALEQSQKNKDALIASLHQHIASLERQISTIKTNKYQSPFPVGVADEPTQIQKK